MEIKGQSIVSIRDFPRADVEAIVNKALEVKAGKWPNALSPLMSAPFGFLFSPLFRGILEAETESSGSTILITEDM